MKMDTPQNRLTFKKYLLLISVYSTVLTWCYLRYSTDYNSAVWCKSYYLWEKFTFVILAINVLFDVKGLRFAIAVVWGGVFGLLLLMEILGIWFSPWNGWEPLTKWLSFLFSCLLLIIFTILFKLKKDA